MLNLLVVMIDCLRQDRFEGPGKTAVTPNLDNFLSRSIAFDNIHAVGSNTTAVMGSWFTGLYPYRHGLRSFRDRKFTGKPPTMAAILRRHGYRTATTVTEAMADAEDLLDGFDEIERRDKKREAIHDGYGERVRLKLAELAGTDRPWFYFVHTCELHPDRQCDPRFRSRRYGKTFYDRCLSSVDHHLAPIFAAIDWSKTLVVVFGDHGDNLLWEPRGELASMIMNRLRADGRVSALWRLRDAFYKAGLYGRWKSVLRHNALFHHDYHVYRFLTRAPLMLVAPGVAPRRCSLPMSSVDMLPTLLEAPPPRALYQEVVTDFILKGRDPSQLRIPLLHALVEGDWKLVDSVFDGRIRPELYDLAADPEERRNLYPRHRHAGFVKALREKLRAVEGGGNRALGTFTEKGAVGASA